ncbi:MAG TPA: hypothetical protein VNP98_02285 [Chthoniobacterales bacterium]|nr:hypothetical protein [Chthoniobacterales bacterium]
MTDLTVTGSLGAYPLKWTRVLNTRGSSGVGFGSGGMWKHNYNWGLTLRPYRPWEYFPDEYVGPDGWVTYPDGRRKELNVEPDNIFYWSNESAEPDDQLVCVEPGDYDLILADGGKVEFRYDGTPPTTTYSPTARRIIDPHGLVTVLERDPATNLLWKILEPGGRYLEISYVTHTYVIYGVNWTSTINVVLISQVQAFARPGQPTEKVGYRYTHETVEQVRYYNLIGVDYDDGTHATYGYFSPGPPPHPAPQTSVVAGRIRTCEDVRHAGAMGKIEYVYAEYGDVIGPVAIGQIKEEKYPGESTYVSKVIYPQYDPYSDDPPEYLRTERRGDGSQRTFQYSNNGSAELERYTDFKGQPSIIDWPDTATVGGYVKALRDARNNTSSTEKDNLTGAVLKITHPGGAFVRFHYSDENNRRYVFSRTDERNKITYYDRDGAHRVWRIRYPDGGFETFTFDSNPFGLVHEHRLTSGGTEVYEAGGWSRESVGAHDGGHLLGRPDGYKKTGPFGAAEYDTNGNPVPREGVDPCNVMVNPDGAPDRQDIDKIVEGNGRGYTEGNAPAGRRAFDAYGSTTAQAVLWEASYGNGGWLALQRNTGF